MPELPEVEHFRRLLLPLVGDNKKGLSIETPSPTPPKSFPTKDEWSKIEGQIVKDVIRKGKLLCMVMGEFAKKGDVTKKKKQQKSQEVYVFLHMGMTGRISNPEYVPKLESINDLTYPPPHTHLTLKANNTEASFSDPRRFGKVVIADSLDEDFGDLAPDALNDGPVDPKMLAGKKKGIKALLLDQRSIVSGIGNWVADEVLYQIDMHPDQTHLTDQEAEKLSESIHFVLSTAVDLMSKNEEFPEEWMFHHRWSKGSADKAKDYKGRAISFVTSGGRTSAIVPSIQKKKGRGGQVTKNKKSESDSKAGVSRKRKSNTGRKKVSKKAKKEPEKVKKEDKKTSEATPKAVKSKGNSATKKEKPKVTKAKRNSSLKKENTDSMPNTSSGRRRSARLQKLPS